MLWFTKLSEEEKRIIRTVWKWQDEGKPASRTPEIKGKALDRVLAKLWVLESSYQAAVKSVEIVIDSLEKVEDSQAVEESESDKERLETSVTRLKRILETLEWLRTQQRGKSFSRL